MRVGQGEIIDGRSKPNQKRNQVDVILYRDGFPKIVYAENCSAFLRESIIATIEVKSTINLDKFRKACTVSIKHKNRRYIQHPDPRRPLDPVGVIEDLTTPIISSYIVAFDGPIQISTVANWLPKIRLEFGITADKLVDMMVILGKGVIWRIESFPQLGGRSILSKNPEATWAYLEQTDKNLLLLFLHLLSQMTSSSLIPIDILGYAKNVSFSKVIAIK